MRYSKLSHTIGMKALSFATTIANASVVTVHSFAPVWMPTIVFWFRFRFWLWFWLWIWLWIWLSVWRKIQGHGHWD